MELKKRLIDEMKQAMKNRESIKLSVIRLLRASIKNEEIDKKKELNDEEIMSFVQREIKKRKESIREFKKGNRDDLVDREEAEMAILYDYLPAQADDKEIRAYIKELVDSFPDGEKIHLGKIMPKAIAKFKGTADGKRISAIVREFI